MWTHILAFVAGAAIGAAIGFIARPKDEDAFEERVAEEVADFKRRYKELREETSAAPVNGEPQREEVKDVVETEEEADARKSYDTVEPEADVTISPTGRGVFEISEREFLDNPQPETEALLYYTLDKTIATVSEDLIPEADSLIGTRYRSMDPDDRIYIRNLDVGVDYEIDAVPYSYKEYVLGE
nr:MAG TPA: YtxH-like protein [Caudoviricetes sp.]